MSGRWAWVAPMGSMLFMALLAGGCGPSDVSTDQGAMDATLDAPLADLAIMDASNGDGTSWDSATADANGPDDGTDAGPSPDCLVAQVMGSRSDAPATLVDLLSIRACDGRPVSGLGAGDLVVRQDDVLVGVDAALHVETRSHSVVRVIHFLVDTTSVSNRVATVASLRAALSELQGAGNPDRNYVAISLFAGQAGVVSGSPTLDYDTLDSELVALGTYVAPDSGASNLNEALIDHVAAAREARLAIAARADGGAFAVGYTVVLTARGDTAGRASDQAAADAIEASGEQVFVAASEILGASESTRLELVANRDVRDVMTEGSNPVDGVTARVVDEIEALYLVSLCSSARAGTHTLSFHGALGVTFENTVSRSFNAVGFTGGCNTAFLDAACAERECGGVLCGACDDRVAACDDATGTCENFCAGNACRGEQITNPLGYLQTCIERSGARVCRDLANYCYDVRLDEPCPCVPEVITGVPDPECPTGTACYPDVMGEPQWTGRCEATGGAQIGDACDDITDCAPGLACGVDARACDNYSETCAVRRCRPLADLATQQCPSGQLALLASFAYFSGGEGASLGLLENFFGRRYSWCEERGVACESDAHCDAFSKCWQGLCVQRSMPPCAVDDSLAAGYRCPDGMECIEYLDDDPVQPVTGRICAPACSCSGATCCDGVTADGFPTVCSSGRFHDSSYDAFPVRGLTTNGENYCIPAWFPTSVTVGVFDCTSTASIGRTCRRVPGPRCPTGLVCVAGSSISLNSCVFSRPPEGEGCAFVGDSFLECEAPQSQTGVPDARCLTGTSCYASASGPPRCYRTGSGVVGATCSASADCQPSLVCTAAQCADPTP